MDSERPAAWTQHLNKLAEIAARDLWGVLGMSALRYLRDRGLMDRTIRGARLGYRYQEEYQSGIFADKKLYFPRGLTIPRIVKGNVEALKICRIDGQANSPTYHFVRGSKRDIYPSLLKVKPGVPVIIVRGELEALLLGQLLENRAAVLTFGGSIGQPSSQAEAAFFVATPWYLAMDQEAGSKTIPRWWTQRPECYSWVGPPSLYRDWVEAWQAGYDVQDFWVRKLGLTTAQAS